MDLSDFGYLIVMGLWAGLVVLLSYRLGYGNGECKAWEAVGRLDGEADRGERLKSSYARSASEDRR
jgi:hypothetical protein